jgi:hypothetical protein
MLGATRSRGAAAPGAAAAAAPGAATTGAAMAELPRATTAKTAKRTRLMKLDVTRRYIGVRQHAVNPYQR